MKRKNQLLVFIAAGLVVINLLVWWSGSVTGGVSFDENAFVEADTASISAIHITNAQGTLDLERLDGKWKLGGAYPVDEGLRKLLFTIMKRVKVQRPVDVPVENPIEFEIVTDADVKVIQVWGNPTKTKTYFKWTDDSQVFQVHIPGYKEYLGSIFELHADQWRDRLLLDGSWRTIQDLQVDYTDPSQQDLKIAFAGAFFDVPNTSRLDSTAVVDYLNLFQYFQVNEWISSERFPEYDSVSQLPAQAMISIQTITEQEPWQLKIYARQPGASFYLLKDQQNRMMAIDGRRVQAILKQPADFELKD